MPETGVLVNHSLGKFERNEWKNERKKDKVSNFLTLDWHQYLTYLPRIFCSKVFFGKSLAQKYPTYLQGGGGLTPPKLILLITLFFSLKTVFFYYLTFITLGLDFFGGEKFELFGEKPPYGPLKSFKISIFLDLLYPLFSL